MSPRAQEDFLPKVGSSACYLKNVDYPALRQRLKLLRESAGYTRKEFAAKAGMSVKWVEAIEAKAGSRAIDPSLAAVEIYATLCGKRLLFDITSPDAAPEVVSAEEREVLATMRSLSTRARGELMKMTALLPKARPDAPEVAVAVLQRLQEEGAGSDRVDPAWRAAVGDPE